MILFILVITLSFSFKVITVQAGERYEAIMEMVSEKLGNILISQEIGINNLSDELRNSLDSPESVMKAMEKEIKLNDYTQGYFMAFEPGYFPEYEKWFEVYMKKDQDHARNIGSAKHDYLSKDWYIKTKQNKNGFWSEPYYDDVGQNDNVCSFTMPLYDKDGRLAGVCGTDMSLEWLAKELKKINANSFDINDDKYFYTFIINNDGTYIAHPDKERVMKKNALSSIDKSSDDGQVIQDMMKMNYGIASVTIDGVSSNIYYAPLGSTNWAMAIVIPKIAIWMLFIIMMVPLVIIIAIGLLVIYSFCHSIIHQAVKPIGALAKSTEEVARGNFEAPLPVIGHKDEVCELRDSFASMQNSLVKYIEETKKTAAKEAALFHDLEVARKIQMSMIPIKFPPFPERKDIDIHGFLTPAKSIGGDLYDFFIRDEKLFFCIGDVSGKGISAALVMSAIHFMFRIVVNKEDDPKCIIETMNNLYASENKSSVFCTFFLGVLDLNTHLLQYCNAGHELPIVINDEIRVIPAKANLALGLFKGKVYRSEEIQLSPGSVFLLYTDGLKEAINKDEECYGMERIKESLQQVVVKGPANASVYVRQLVNDVTDYMGEMPPADDLTLLAIKINESENQTNKI
jgi:sigma-B regulation protein RsbU (phosphoserine phosphatase)